MLDKVYCFYKMWTFRTYAFSDSIFWLPFFSIPFLKPVVLHKLIIKCVIILCLHLGTCVQLKLYVILSLFYRPLLCEMLDTLLDLTKLGPCAFIDRQHKYKKNLLQSYSPSWNDYNHFLNFMCDIEIVYLARNTPFILTETLYQWIFVFLIPCICIVLSNEIPTFILTETLYQWIFVCRIPCICLLWVITKISTDPNKVNFLYATF